MMSLNEFYNEVKTDILDYMPPEYQGEVQIVPHLKTNDCYKMGVTIKRPDSRVSPVIYLEKPYEDYLKGATMEEVLGVISATYMEAEKEGKNRLPESFDLSYDSIRDDLRLRLVHRDENLDNLDRLVSKKLTNGYFMTAGIVMKSDGQEELMVRVTKEMAMNYDYDPEQLFRDAQAGSEKNERPVFMDMTSAISGFFVEESESEAGSHLLADQEPIPEGAYDRELHILTNENRLNGAATLFYPGVQDQVATVVGKSYFVLPSSVHEVLILADDGEIRPEDLNRMVYDINREQVEPQERLSDKALYYDKDTRQLLTAESRDQLDKAHEKGMKELEKGQREKEADAR